MGFWKGVWDTIKKVPNGPRSIIDEFSDDCNRYILGVTVTSVLLVVLLLILVVAIALLVF